MVRAVAGESGAAARQRLPKPQDPTTSQTGMLPGKAAVPFPPPRVAGWLERGQKVQLLGLRRGKKAEPRKQGAKKEEELFHKSLSCLRGWDICGGSAQGF